MIKEIHSDFLNFKLGSEIGDVKQNLDFSIDDRVVRKVKNQFNDYNYIYSFASADLEFNLFFNYYKGRLSTIVLVEVVNLFSNSIEEELKIERQKIINLYKKKYDDNPKEIVLNEKDTWSIWEVEDKKEILINQTEKNLSSPLRIEYRSIQIEKLKENDDINNI